MAKTSIVREVVQEGSLREGLEAAIRERVREVIELILEEEADAALGAGCSQRLAERSGYRHGGKNRRLTLRSGVVALVERLLEHENGEARAFYASSPKPVLVGMEATGHAQWFERMLVELGQELWIGHASVVRKQKTDARDAAHLLDLLVEKRFPRIWIPSPAERDTRQLLRHRYKLVCFRTSIKNQLNELAMSQGVCRKKKLFTAKGREELEKLSLDPRASGQKRRNKMYQNRVHLIGDLGKNPEHKSVPASDRK